MRAIKNALESLSQSMELEGGIAERLKALHAIRSHLWQSASRGLLLKDAARAAWRSYGGNFKSR